MFSAEPPSNAVPSIVPLNETVTRSPLCGLGAVGLGGKAVLIGDALDGIIDLGVGYFSDRLLDLEALEIGERDRRHHLDRHRVGEIGFAREKLLDLFLLGRHGDLGLRRQAEAALGEELRIGVADGLVDGLRHHRTAIDLLQMADRHLARTEAVDADLVLQFHQTRIGLGIEISGGNADLKLVLQSLGNRFFYLHGFNLLLKRSGTSRTACSEWRIASCLAPAVSAGSRTL